MNAINTIANCTALWNKILWFTLFSNNLSNNITKNQAFFESLLTGCKNYPDVTCGVEVDSVNFWNQYFGSNYTAGSSLNLWYWVDSFPYQPSFNDFVPFGGWQKPTMKRYSFGAIISSCSALYSYNLDWKP